jgi:predicted PurR-regulated permease PerM
VARASVKSKKSSTAPFAPRVLQAAIAIAIIGGFLFIKPYFGAILFSALIAFIFNPVYKALLRKTRKSGLAIAITLVVAVLSVVIPCIFIVTVTVAQVNSIVSKYQSGSLSVGPAQLQETVDRGVDRANAVVSAAPGGEQLHIDKQKVEGGLKNALVDGLKFLAQTLTNVGLAFFSLISTFILSIFLISSMLRYQDELIDLLKRISPFDNSINDLYLKRAGLMTKGMVKGQFIIASVQGFASAFSLWIVGVDYFWFLFVFLSFLSFIPLGAGIITIPIGFVFILTGHFWQGAFIILWHMFVVSSIDNILRPHLVDKDARLNTALMLLAVFSGIAVFGAAGVVYGPVIMILIVTTIYVYAEFNKSAERISLPGKKLVSGKPTPK